MLTAEHGKHVELNERLRIIATEFADQERGCKIVFRGTNANGKAATFETGSFLDQKTLEGNLAKHDICVSTAGGCTRKCEFCSVPRASLGFERLLTAEEIFAQIAYADQLRNPQRLVPNVVGFMGNGEPPDNFQNLIDAIRMTEESDIAVDRYTFSSIGENTKGIEQIASFAATMSTPLQMQLSLHSPNDERRRMIIPGKRTIEEIMQATDMYYDMTGLAVKFNVVLMESDGFTNASAEDAQLLAALLHSPSRVTGQAIPRRLKLSHFNPIPGIGFRAPTAETSRTFVSVLQAEGVNEIKTFKGSGIDIEGGKGGFACGQLRATTASNIDLVV